MSLPNLHGKYFIVTTFSHTPMAGNPAAVVFLNQDVEAYTDNHLLRIAQELASVEVAFVLPAPEHSKCDFALRFFTKTGETPFCGHAAVAAAKAILEHVPEFKRTAIEIQFHIIKNENTVVVRKRRNVLISEWHDTSMNKEYLELSLKPTLPTKATFSEEDLKKLAFCLSLPAGESRIRDVYPHYPSKNLVVVLKSIQDVLAAKTNRNAVLAFLASKKSNEGDFKKLTITAAVPDKNSIQYANLDPKLKERFDKYDFVSRLFAPAIGIDEDAASAASGTYIALLWRDVLEQRFALKKQLVAHQASFRGGDMINTFYGVRVGVSGGAVIVAEGEVKVLVDPTLRKLVSKL
jgi:PhzF family phenazine biosynthesis protein